MEYLDTRAYYRGFLREIDEKFRPASGGTDARDQGHLARLNGSQLAAKLARTWCGFWCPGAPERDQPV